MVALVLGAALTAFLAIIPVNAGPVDASQQCRASARRAARMTGVPEPVLLAISLVETGRRRDGQLRSWPWTINLGGKGYWFRTRREAQEFARTMVSRGVRSMDIGCFQINTRWHGAAFPSVDAMFDPAGSAVYAARLLAALRREKGSWQAAAGAYHSRRPARARAYAARFQRVLDTLVAEIRRPSGDPRLTQAAPKPKDRRPNTYPLLRVLAETRAAPGSLVFISDHGGKGLF